MSAEINRIRRVDDVNFRGFLQNPQAVLMMGYKGGPRCEDFKWELERITGRFPQVSFGVTWVDQKGNIRRFQRECRELFEEFDIPPTTVLLRDGVLEGSMSGFYRASEIQSRISKVFSIKIETGFWGMFGIR